jgi:hypothetical protein
MTMAAEEQPDPDFTLQAIHELLATMQTGPYTPQGIANTLRQEYLTVDHVTARAVEEDTAPAAHHLGWSTVRVSYLGVEVPRTYENVEDIAIGDAEMSDEARTVLEDLADEMLRQAGRTVSGDVRDLLVRHVSGGIESVITAGTNPEDDSGSDPLHDFFGKVQRGLHDGSLVRGLEAAAEIQAALPPPSSRGGIIGKLQARWAVMAAAAERHTRRQAQLQETAARAHEQGFVQLDDLQPGDEVALTVSADNYEDRDQIERKGDPLMFTKTIRGKVESVEERAFSSKMQGKQAVVLRITGESRNSDLHFTDSPVREGEVMVLFGTEAVGTVCHSYEDLPIIGDELQQGYPPILFDQDGFPLEMQVSNLGGYASMGLAQLTVNGQSLFQEGWRPHAESDPENRYSGVE